MAPKLSPGDRVVMQMRNYEVFEATIDSITPNRIEVFDVYIRFQDTEYDGNLVFYRNEILSISRIVSHRSLTEMPSSETSSVIKMHSEEFQRLKHMAIKYTFIDIYDKRFHDAVDILKDRESIGVVGLGNTFLRGRPLSLLVMCDYKQVFVFDMFVLRELRDLGDILSSQYTTKVVHDGAALFDCLYHRYNVEMKNVFDTQKSDAILEKKLNPSCKEEVRRNIGECMSHHFNFPTGFLAPAIEDSVDTTWVERPVSKSNKLKASQLVTYLLTLKDHFMKIILEEHTAAVTNEYEKFKTMSDTDFLKFNEKLTISNGAKDSV